MHCRGEGKLRMAVSKNPRALFGPFANVQGQEMLAKWRRSTLYPLPQVASSHPPSYPAIGVFLPGRYFCGACLTTSLHQAKSLCATTRMSSGWFGLRKQQRRRIAVFRNHEPFHNCLLLLLYCYCAVTVPVPEVEFGQMPKYLFVGCWALSETSPTCRLGRVKLRRRGAYLNGDTRSHLPRLSWKMGEKVYEEAVFELQ